MNKITKNIKNDVVLYVLVRTDMDSLNLSKGKIAAQVSHAANAMVHDMEIRAILSSEKYDKDHAKELLEKWRSVTTQGYGTCIVLDGKNEENITNVVDAIHGVYDLRTIYAGIVEDPTYPIKDGNVIHTLPCKTCAWILTERFDIKDSGLLDDFKLL